MEYKRRKAKENSTKLVTEASQGVVSRYKMIENELLPIYHNNQIGRKIKRYFIKVEKRYKVIVKTPQNIFDFMRLAIN